MANICQTRTMTRHYSNTTLTEGANYTRTKAKQSRNKIAIWVYKIKCKEIEFERKTYLSTPLVSCPSHFPFLHVNYKFTRRGLFIFDMKLEDIL